jgi:hypothetical protein
MITLRPIKPNKLAFDASRLQAAIQAELRNQGQEAKKLYEQVTSSWQHKPAFVVTVTGDSVTVTTADEIFGYVDLGTRPHIIRPTGGKMLRFNAGGFVPKTMPRSLSSGSGSPGSGQVFAREVHHPGTKPRNFDITIAKKRAKPFATEMQRAIDKAVK